VSNKLRATLRDPQRNAARLALAALLGLMALMLAVAPMGGPFSGLAISQTASPTASETIASSIFFLNPAEGTSTEISAKADGTDASYHLVASASAVPPDPTVEFKYAEGDVETDIGPGSRVGASDTWEFDWTTLPADGDYTVIAILFSGPTEVSRHELEVVVNNEDGPRELPLDPEPQGETVEMMYPVNGGPLGFYTERVKMRSRPRSSTSRCPTRSIR